jgi:uncharacterized protein YdeI (YjbR/CyaY-like superfamily)
MENSAPVSKHGKARGNTVSDLAEVLRSYDAEDKFRALSPEAQLGYIDWIDQATDPEHRERRLRMIVAVIARSTAQTIKLDD